MQKLQRIAPRIELDMAIAKYRRDLNRKQLISKCFFGASLGFATAAVAIAVSPLAALWFASIPTVGFLGAYLSRRS